MISDVSEYPPMACGCSFDKLSRGGDVGEHVPEVSAHESDAEAVMIAGR